MEDELKAEKAYIEITEWWITDGFFDRGGNAVMGPFVSQQLAAEVRTLRETVEGHANYFIDKEVRHVRPR